MKKLKDLKGIEVLSKNEQKSLIGGGSGMEACYCPQTGVFAGIIHPDEGQTCWEVINENCLLES